jgi:hypothetical protein
MAFQRYVARAARPVKPPTRLSQLPPAEMRFFLVVDDREGIPGLPTGWSSIEYPCSRLERGL